MPTLIWIVVLWLGANAMIPLAGLIVSLRISRGGSPPLPDALRDYQTMFEHGPEQRALEAHLAAVARKPYVL